VAQTTGTWAAEQLHHFVVVEFASVAGSEPLADAPMISQMMPLGGFSHASAGRRLRDRFQGHSDVFYPVSSQWTRDFGKTWSPTVEHTAKLGHRPLPNGHEEGICDFTPTWHAKTETLLGTGQTVRLDDRRRPIPANLTVRGSREDSVTDIDGSRIKHGVTFADREFTPEGIRELTTSSVSAAD